MVGLTAIVPGSNFVAFRFAGIETGDEILATGGPRTARLARYGEVTPRIFTFFRRASFIVANCSVWTTVQLIFD